VKILRFDSIGGASGDMILASLVDLGVEMETLSGKLSRLVPEKFAIEKETVSDRGFTGTRLRISPGESRDLRRLDAIVSLLRGGKLPASVEKAGIMVFRRLAEAEARVHGTTPDKIHFHEIGAIDSIIDIAGACLAVEMLGVDAVITGPLPTGAGVVESGHGILPIPAPATVELLK